MDFDKKDISSSMSRYIEHAKWTIKCTHSGPAYGNSTRKWAYHIALLSVSTSKSSIDYTCLLHSLFTERKLINELLNKPEQYKSAEFNRAVVKDP